MFIAQTKIEATEERDLLPAFLEISYRGGRVEFAPDPESLAFSQPHSVELTAEDAQAIFSLAGVQCIIACRAAATNTALASAAISDDLLKSVKEAVAEGKALFAAAEAAKAEEGE